MRLAHGGTTRAHFGRRLVLPLRCSRAPIGYVGCLMYRNFSDSARYHRGAIPRQAFFRSTLVGEPWERVSVDPRVTISTYLRRKPFHGLIVARLQLHELQ